MALEYYKFKWDIATAISSWDASHGEAEIQHRIDTLYNSDAIFCKSLLTGVTLGCLPTFLFLALAIHWKLETTFVEGSNKAFPYSQQLLGEGWDGSLNRLVSTILRKRCFLFDDS